MSLIVKVDDGQIASIQSVYQPDVSERRKRLFSPPHFLPCCRSYEGPVKKDSAERYSQVREVRFESE